MHQLELRGWGRQRVARWLAERRRLRSWLRVVLLAVGVGALVVGTAREVPSAGVAVFALAVLAAALLELAKLETPIRPPGNDRWGLFDLWAWSWSWFWQTERVGLVLRMKSTPLLPSVDRDWVRGKARGLEGVHGLIDGRECLAQRLVITSANEHELLLQTESAVGFVLDREQGQPVIVVEGTLRLELGERDVRSPMDALLPLLTQWGMPPRVLEGAAREVTIADGDDVEIASELHRDAEGGYREAQGVVLHGTPIAPITVRKV